MKRRFLCLFLVLCMMAGSLPAVSAADNSGTWGGNISWSFNENTGHLVISGTGKMPETNSTPPWYSLRFKTNTAEIRSGVTSLADWCFFSFHDLTEVSISETVRDINSNAFYGCESLKSIRLPSGLTGIGIYTFEGCKSLTSIDIPGSVTSITGPLFRNCSSLRTVTLHSGLKKIGDYAFKGSAITSISIPDTVTSIGREAFSGTGLTAITLPNHLEIIEYGAFSSCPALKSVTLPKSVSYVGGAAFGNSGLKMLVVLNSKCSFSNFDDQLDIGGAGVDVYGYPGSTVQKMIKEGPDSPYTFKPIYFDDVAPGKWYFDSVSFAKENGLFNGVGNRAFAPEKPMTRAMLVQVLYNLAGDDEYHENPFADVPEKAWYAKAVAWAADYGIVNGIGPGVFAPEENVTREQIAVIVHRFTQGLGIDTEGEADLSGFPDGSKVGKWAKSALAWAVDKEIVSGSKNNGKVYLQPKANATRAQVAAIMMRCVLYWDDCLHSTLRIGIGNMGLIPYVEKAAAAYMKQHEDIRIEVVQSEVMTYDDVMQYRMNEDAVLMVGKEFYKKYNRSGTSATVLLSTPFVFATTQNNKDNIKDIPDMIRQVKDQSIMLCLCRLNTPARNYAAKLLAEYGIEQLTDEQYEYEDNVYSVEFNLSFGMTQCGTVTEHLALVNGLHILEDSRRDGQVDHLCAYYPEDSDKAEALEGFFAYLQTCPDAMRSSGFYPIDN